MVNRVAVSYSAYEICGSALQRFPELGTRVTVYRIAALISLNRNGYIEERPDDMEINHNSPIQIAGGFEISSDRNRNPILFPTLIQLVANCSMTLEEIYRQAAFHIHLGSALLKDIADKADTIE